MILLRPSDHFQSIHQVPRGPVVWDASICWSSLWVDSQLMAWVFSVMVWSLCAMGPFWPFCYIPRTPWLYQKIRIPWISSSSIKLGFFLRPVWGGLKLKTFLLVSFIQLLLYTKWLFFLQLPSLCQNFHPQCDYTRREDIGGTIKA